MMHFPCIYLGLDYVNGDYIRHYPNFCHGKPFLSLRWLRGGVWSMPRFPVI